MSDETLTDINKYQGMKRYTPVVDWKQTGPRAYLGYDPNGKAVLYAEAQAEIDRLTEALTTILGWREHDCYGSGRATCAIEFMEETARVALSQGEK